MKPTPFEAIRPYLQEEIAPAMQRIADSEYLPRLASFVFPEKTVKDVQALIRQIHSTEQFQQEVMRVVNEQIIKRSISSFTYHGLEHIQPQTPYLFVSNHRDIMLDSSLLQYVLLTNGFETSEITFGANLMTHPLVVDIGKSNKMFRVERGGTPKEFYQFSMQNAAYIRDAIVEKKHSVWIAQRNGRTKDGLDGTEPGLIRMFAGSYPQDATKALIDLNIVPIAVSYEWETCDILKAKELYVSQFQTYEKKPGEDLNSILTGITEQKGHVHIEICEPIRPEELQDLKNSSSKDYFKAVAQVIDKRINEAYFLHPNNYIAWDLLHQTDRYVQHYMPEQKERFLARLAELEAFQVVHPEQLRALYLGIYANSIVTKQNITR